MSRSLLVKTIKGEAFRVDVAEECKMSDVKAKISEVRGDDPASQQLICGGKMLKDDDALATGVPAGGFLVLMVKKRRAAPAVPAASAPAAAAAPVPAPTPAAAAAAAAPPAPVAAAAAAAATPAATPASAPAPSPPPPAAAGAGAGAGAAAGGGGGGDGLAVDPASVEMLTAMGFPEDQATAALRAAFNDVSRAASYLMEGIPDDVVAAGASSGGGAGAGVRQQGGDDAMGGADAEDGGAADLAEALMEMQGGEGNPLNFMRFHPQFDQLRNLVRENPAMLPQVLQGLANQSPELIERINQHPDDFLRLMNEPPDAAGQAMMDMGAAGFMEEDEDGEQGEAAAAAGVGVGVAGGDGGQGGPVTVELTEEENEAVENLMAMVPGVGRDQVIEAFIACDKNAEMAANLLFENAL